MNNPLWLDWAQRLQAIAQIGLTYCKDPFDVGRYEAIREIAAEIMAKGAGLTDASVITDLFMGDAGYATPKARRTCVPLSSIRAAFCGRSQPCRCEDSIVAATLEFSAINS